MCSIHTARAQLAVRTGYPDDTRAPERVDRADGETYRWIRDGAKRESHHENSLRGQIRNRRAACGALRCAPCQGPRSNAVHRAATKSDRRTCAATGAIASSRTIKE